MTSSKIKPPAQSVAVAAQSVAVAAQSVAVAAGQVYTYNVSKGPQSDNPFADQSHTSQGFIITNTILAVSNGYVLMQRQYSDDPMPGQVHIHSESVSQFLIGNHLIK